MNLGFNRLAPIYRGEKPHGMGAECRREVKQLCQINPQRAAFDFGNGAARGVESARELQGVRQAVLRPALLVTQLGNLPPDEISLFHF